MKRKDNYDRKKDKWIKCRICPKEMRLGSYKDYLKTVHRGSDLATFEEHKSRLIYDHKNSIFSSDKVILNNWQMMSVQSQDKMSVRLSI